MMSEGEGSLLLWTLGKVLFNILLKMAPPVPLFMAVLKTSPRCNGFKQQPFYYTPGFCGREFGQGTKEMACLCSTISGTSRGDSRLRGKSQSGN